MSRDSSPIMCSSITYCTDLPFSNAPLANECKFHICFHFFQFSVISPLKQRFLMLSYCLCLRPQSRYKVPLTELLEQKINVKKIVITVLRHDLIIEEGLCEIIM